MEYIQRIRKDAGNKTREEGEGQKGVCKFKLYREIKKGKRRKKIE